MNMVGKISGLDWSKAHIDATHVAHDYLGKYSCWSSFYKQEDGVWYFDIDNKGCWCISSNAKKEWFKPVSKEEDLGMNVKVVKSIKDLDVGMFVKNVEGQIYMYNGRTLCLTNPAYDEVDAWNKSYFSNFVGLKYPHNNNRDIVSWSYTYNGEYTPVAVESEQDLKIKALEEEAKKAIESVEKIQKQLKELKGE